MLEVVLPNVSGGSEGFCRWPIVVRLTPSNGPDPKKQEATKQRALLQSRH